MIGTLWQRAPQRNPSGNRCTSGSPPIAINGPVYQAHRERCYVVAGQRYSLALEHRYPTPPRQMMLALEYLQANAERSRFGVEWARVEPGRGEFSAAALDHYSRVVDFVRLPPSTSPL
jgi:hypothetical protein